jgi:hypothetical protein
VALREESAKLAKLVKTANLKFQPN